MPSFTITPRRCASTVATKPSAPAPATSAAPAVAPPAAARDREMTDDQEPRAPGDSGINEQENRASEVLQQLISRDPELWSNAALSLHNDSTQSVRTSGYEKRILGTTGRGARIQAVDTHFKREQSRLKANRSLRGEFLGTDTVWDVTDDTHGVSIVVINGEAPDKRRLYMFVPDNPSHEELYRTHKIEIETTQGRQILRPADGEAFSKALAEIEFYLGDEIEWDEKTPSFDEELSI